MAKDAVLQQFDACIASLEQEIARIEGGECDEADLAALAEYAILPEFESSVGKYCTFPDVRDFVAPSPPAPALHDKRGPSGRFSKKRKADTLDKDKDTDKDESAASSSSVDISSTPQKAPAPARSTTTRNSPRRSKRAKKE